MFLSQRINQTPTSCLLTYSTLFGCWEKGYFKRLNLQKIHPNNIVKMLSASGLFKSHLSTIIPSLQEPNSKRAGSWMAASEAHDFVSTQGNWGVPLFSASWPWFSQLFSRRHSYRVSGAALSAPPGLLLSIFHLTLCPKWSSPAPWLLVGLAQESADFSLEGQIIHILGFGRHQVSVTATQLCYCSVKADMTIGKSVSLAVFQ